MKAMDVSKAMSLLGRRQELVGYLKNFKEADTLILEVNPNFRIALTPAAMQELIDRICKQYIAEIDKIERELENLGVEPD